MFILASPFSARLPPRIYTPVHGRPSARVIMRASGPQHPGRVSGVQQRIPTLNLILNLNPKLDLIPKLITVATPPDTHPRYIDPTVHDHFLYYYERCGICLSSAKSIVLLLFLQKQNLATAIYLFGLGTLLTGLGLKHMRIRSHHDLAGALVTSLLLGRPWRSTTSPTCLPLSVFTITSDQH